MPIILTKSIKNTYWHDEVEQEIKEVWVAFKDINVSPGKLFGYQEINAHLVFDIKLSDNFRRKEQLVTDGNQTRPPISVTYGSVFLDNLYTYV